MAIFYLNFGPKLRTCLVQRVGTPQLCLFSTIPFYSTRTPSPVTYPRILFRSVDEHSWALYEKTLREEQRTGLTLPNILILDNGSEVLESRCSLTPAEFIGSALQVCEKHHSGKCDKCDILLRVCSEVRKEKVVAMSELWSKFVGKSYASDRARRLFLQAPLAFLTIGQPKSGLSQIYVCEKSTKELYGVVHATITEAVKENKKLDCAQLIKDICSIAENGAQKEIIKFTAAAVTNSSRRDAKNNLGISLGRKDSRRKKVIAAIEKAKIEQLINHELMLVEVEAKIGFVPAHLRLQYVFSDVDESEESEEESDGSHSEEDLSEENEGGKEKDEGRSVISDEQLTRH